MLNQFPVNTLPGQGKSDILTRLFRRHWWQFWKPRMPMIRPSFMLVATLRPEDLKGYLVPPEVQQLMASAPSPGHAQPGAPSVLWMEQP